MNPFSLTILQLIFLYSHFGGAVGQSHFHNNHQIPFHRGVEEGERDEMGMPCKDDLLPYLMPNELRLGHLWDDQQTGDSNKMKMQGDDHVNVH